MVYYFVPVAYNQEGLCLVNVVIFDRGGFLAKTKTLKLNDVFFLVSPFTTINYEQRMKGDYILIL